MSIISPRRINGFPKIEASPFPHTFRCHLGLPLHPPATLVYCARPPLGGLYRFAKNSSLGNRFQGQLTVYAQHFNLPRFPKQPTLTGAFCTTPQCSVLSFAPVSSCVSCSQVRVLSLVNVMYFNCPLSNHVYYLFISSICNTYFGPILVMRYMTFLQVN
jgi:hypothetical protein